MRIVEITLPHEDIDALRNFVRFHSKGTNVLKREWLNNGSKTEEEVKYIFKEVSK